MGTSLSKAKVEAVAALAHLELDPSEVELFARQLSGILAYADEVLQIDTQGVPPTYGVARQAVDRPDTVAPSLEIDDALANAPDRDRSFFKVPRVIG